MSTFLQFILNACIPIVITCILYNEENKAYFKKFSYKKKQLIIGVIFGLVAIWGTEMGIQINGAVINTRNVAPLSAGLIFGAPAGIIAGVIGGVERWFASLWGAGIDTRLACSLATIFAGLFAGLSRKLLFDDKKPSYWYGLIITCIVEAFHMLLVFWTNMSNLQLAFEIIQKATIPMVLINGLAVTVALALVTYMSTPQVKNKAHIKNIAQSFQKWLLLALIIPLIASVGFQYALQTRTLEDNAQRMMSLAIQDVGADIMDASDENLLAVTESITAELQTVPTINQDILHTLKEKYNVSEINLIDEDGKIWISTTPDYIGFEMDSGKQSGEFLQLLDGKTDHFVQPYQTVSHALHYDMKYAGKVLPDGGFVQVGYDSERFQEDIDRQVLNITGNRHVGENGYMLIANEDKTIVTNSINRTGEQLSDENIQVSTTKSIRENKFGPLLHGSIFGQESYCMYDKIEGYYILAIIPDAEILNFRDMSFYITLFMQIIIKVLIFLIIYLLIKKLIVENIQKINDDLAEITNGNLNVSVDVRSNEEFASLSDDINETVSTLKDYIAEAAARIDKELEFAQTIQCSTLPNTFPAFPDRDNFDIYATMHTAKEVGGDFYDFYLVDDNHLAFLMADVSGKGISAAMFMMKAKTVLRNYAKQKTDVAEIMTLANAELSENNEADMFVTCWMGIIDLTTYEVRFANAGHTIPLVRHKDGQYAYFKTRPGFVLGGMPGIRYREGSLQLAPGDEIYLYTDGVTEATDGNSELYGEPRLLQLMQTVTDESAEAICKLVKDSVDAFVGDEPQFDDITMLCLQLTEKKV